MSNEKRLRDALNWLVHLHHGVSKGGERTGPPSDDEWKQCLQEGKDVLDATAGDPEMDRLVEWLEATKFEPTGYTYAPPDVANATIDSTLAYIREMQEEQP